MTESLDIYLQALKQAGHRITAQRHAVCAFLAATHSHPTPYQVYDELSQVHPEISRATVYNTLNVLQKLGVIVEIALGADHTHYDTDPTPHVNLICLRCHAIVDYHLDVPLAALQDDIVQQTDFQPIGARVDVVGFCAACRDLRRAEIVAQWREHNHLPGTTNTPSAGANA